MRPLPVLRGVLLVLGGVLLGAAAVWVSDMSLPISAMNGRWQIEDWLDHPQATEQVRREYTEVRRQFPRTIEVRPFWRASLGEHTDCSWSQHVRSWSWPRLHKSTDVWETAIACPGLDPVKLWLIPSNVNNQARNLAGLRDHFTGMNNHEIGVTFDLGRGDVREIFYVPASWPRGSIDGT